MSCASRPARAPAPPQAAPVSVAAPPAKPPAFARPEAEAVIQKFTRDSPEVRKYFVTDGAGNVTVKGELTQTPQGGETPETFEAVYDIKNAQSREPGVYEILFSVRSRDGAAADGAVWEGALLWKPEKGEEGVLLGFDDNYVGAWTRHFDLFDSFNARVTFFVQGRYNAFCTEAFNRGHDIGYHTLSHANLREVSREVFDRETLSETEAFKNARIPLAAFAYPYGFSDEWMHGELLKNYRVLRNYGVRLRIYDREAIRAGVISSMAVDNTILKSDEDFYAAVNLSLRIVKFLGRGYILPITTHDISDTAEWGIKPARLRYLLQAVQDLRLNFYRYRDLAGDGGE